MIKHTNDTNLYEKIITAHTVCFECGEKYGKHKAGICTVYKEICDICEKETSCTEFRDFGYNDVNLDTTIKSNV